MTKEALYRIVDEILTKIKREYPSTHVSYEGRAYNVKNRASRIELIRKVTDDYTAANGKRPDNDVLERLTDAVLNEELSDPHPDKVTREEYPFFSEHQLEVRAAREPVVESFRTSGTDGRDYRLPTRRARTDYELWFVDKNAKSRNSARRRQYARDKAPGKVSSVMSEPFVQARLQGKKWRNFS